MARPMSPTEHLVDRQPLVIGPFTVTPFLNDHSAFDAYSMLIEADGRRIFYTGDIRGHGRKRALFDRLVEHAPSDVDVLLMEGTHVRAGGAHDDVEFDSEADLEEQFIRVCRETAGAVVVFGSAQNLDRVVTVFRSARRSGREFVVDLYGASVA
ncbi:MAG: MBL fold metallo-hydrolase, partial [Gaiellales bacterium]